MRAEVCVCVARGEIVSEECGEEGIRRPHQKNVGERLFEDRIRRMRGRGYQKTASEERGGEVIRRPHQKNAGTRVSEEWRGVCIWRQRTHRVAAKHSPRAQWHISNEWMNKTRLSERLCATAARRAQMDDLSMAWHLRSPALHN